MLLFFAPQAFAHAKSSEGFCITGNVVVTNSTFEVSTATLNGTATSNSTNLALQGQYSWALNEKNLLGLGTTKREFLDDMNLVVPWTELVVLIEPRTPSGKTGGPPFAVVTMLRIHFMQQ